jgi:hypothetical protein
MQLYKSLLTTIFFSIIWSFSIAQIITPEEVIKTEPKARI